MEEGAEGGVLVGAGARSRPPPPAPAQAESMEEGAEGGVLVGAGAGERQPPSGEHSKDIVSHEEPAGRRELTHSMEGTEVGAGAGELNSAAGRAGDEIISHEDGAAATSAPAAAAPPTTASAAASGDGKEPAGRRELTHSMEGTEVGARARAGELNSPAGRAGDEILSHEEAAAATSAREAAAPPTAASAAASGDGDGDGREQQRARAILEVESRGGGGLRTVTWTNNWGANFCAMAHPKLAKLVYMILFAGGITMAMSSRYLELSAFTQRVNGYNDDRFLLGAESSLRVSLAFFLFFLVMFLTTVWTKKLHDCRNFWNSNLFGPLLVKVAMVAASLYVAQLPTSSYIELYGNIARAGAWLFLIIQLISITKFIMRVNTWQQLNPEKRLWLVRPATILSNFGSFGVIFWLLHENRSNIVEFVIAGVTLVLMVIMLCIYLKSEVTAGWLALGLMLSYIVAMSWTVIRSAPHRESTEAKDPKGPDWLTIMSLCFMAYSALSTGEDEWLQFNNEEQSEDNIPYGFGYFHLVFALGSMYFGMILVGWNAYQTMQRWTVDFGWWSAVVRAVNGFLGVVLYIWMLRTPFIWNKKKLVLSFPEASWVPHATFI